MKLLPPKQYYVHALLWLWGGEYRLGPYRFHWYAKWRAHALMAEYPYGIAAITRSPKSPPVVRD
jgi:hypothetical protein